MRLRNYRDFFFQSQNYKINQNFLLVRPEILFIYIFLNFNFQRKIIIIRKNIFFQSQISKINQKTLNFIYLHFVHEIFKSMKILIFPFLSLLFTSSISQCPNFPCKFCPFSQTDSYYLQNFKLPITQNTSVCVQKQIFSNENRKIFIHNSNLTILGYDSIYFTLAEAFLAETKISSNSLFSSIDITLEKGDHHIIDNDLIFKYSEFFRRILINVTISSENINFPSRIFVKTNKLFIFISANFILENLIFLGNDSTNQQISNNLQKFTKSNKYGFFNVEFIFDNNFKITPNFSLINCSFLNFFPLNPEGFLNLISLAPIAGNLNFLSVFIENVLFPESLIISDEFDIFYSGFEIDSFPLENFTQRIVLENIVFENIGSNIDFYFLSIWKKLF